MVGNRRAEVVRTKEKKGDEDILRGWIAGDRCATAA